MPRQRCPKICLGGSGGAAAATGEGQWLGGATNTHLGLVSGCLDAAAAVAGAEPQQQLLQQLLRWPTSMCYAGLGFDAAALQQLLQLRSGTPAGLLQQLLR